MYMLFTITICYFTLISDDGATRANVPSDQSSTSHRHAAREVPTAVHPGPGRPVLTILTKSKYNYTYLI